MWIFVSGPYSGNAEEIEKNVSVADEAGKELLRRGHFPFVPHTMMKGWQELQGLSWEDVIYADLAWIDKCDGLLFLGPSPGSNLERKAAKRLGIRIFNSVDEVPFADEGISEAIKHDDQDAQLQAYLTEYRDCAESYRHTYQTIWQAGAIFIAATFVIIALVEKNIGFTPFTVLLAPIPFLFWFLAIFLPMNAYGEFRSGHLVTIERKLNRLPYQLNVEHYKEYNNIRNERKKERKPGVGIWTQILGWPVLAYWVSSVIVWIISFLPVNLPSWFKYPWPWLF